MFTELISAILAAQQDPSQIPVVANLARSVTDWDDARVDELIEQLADFGDELQESEPDLAPESPLPLSRMDQILQPIIHQLAARELNRKQNASQTPVTVTRQINPDGWSDLRLRSIETLYRLAPVNSDLRNHLLRWLATSWNPEAIELWSELVCQDPPEHRLGIGLAFAPLMQPGFRPGEKLLSLLLTQATAHSQIAPVVFDLFNYYVRSGQVKKHPALPRAAPLTELLGRLVGQLSRIEDGDFPANFAARQINQLVSDSVALIVALCDTFALTGHEAAIPKLHQALRLRHRRVQTEAAAALARLQDETGKQALIALAEQPVTRLRVLAYADELGFKQEISLELQGEIALAESQLAIWLAEPDQMGLAPSNLELLDNREMFWPGFEHPVACYLFKYAYGTGESAHRNIGICGPLTHAFAADLQHLPIDEIYAAFAGWQTIHQDIFQMSSARATQVFPNELQRLQSGLDDDTLDDVKVQTVGSFFGDLVLVATARCEGQSGTIIVDNHDSTWYETGNFDAPIDWKLAYTIWRGKQLLSKFNSSEPS